MPLFQYEVVAQIVVLSFSATGVVLKLNVAASGSEPDSEPDSESKISTGGKKDHPSGAST